MAINFFHNPSDNKRQAGFTLVEVLCVLALLGLTAGLVVLNLPKPASPFRAEVQSVTTLLNLAAQQSVIDGKSRGIDFTPSEFNILEYDGAWVVDRTYEFKDMYGFELAVDHQDVDLVEREKKKEKSDLPPLIYFDATGNVTPFHLSFEGREDSYTLSPDSRGRIVMEPVL